MAKKQFLGVKYPFTAESNYKTLVDMNETTKDKVRSILMHVIFTPKGQKLRDPEFGSNLIRYIFEPNDSMTMESVQTEIADLIHKYAGENINLTDLMVMKNEYDPSQIFVKVAYTVFEGYKSTKDGFIVKL